MDMLSLDVDTIKSMSEEVTGQKLPKETSKMISSLNDAGLFLIQYGFILGRSDCLKKINIQNQKLMLDIVSAYMDLVSLEKDIGEADFEEKYNEVCKKNGKIESFSIIAARLMFENIRETSKNEFYYQKLFKEKCESLGYGKPTTRKSNLKDIPDAWVERNGEKIPVEVKLRDFNESALDQLLRYISSYKAKRGIAVGEKLTVELPANIEFVSLDQLKA